MKGLRPKRGGRAPRLSTTKKKTLKVLFHGWGILSPKGMALEGLRVDQTVSMDEHDCLRFIMGRLDGAPKGSTLVRVSAVLERLTKQQGNKALRASRSL